MYLQVSKHCPVLYLVVITTHAIHQTMSTNIMTVTFWNKPTTWRNQQTLLSASTNHKTVFASLPDLWFNSSFWVPFVCVSLMWHILRQWRARAPGRCACALRKVEVQLLTYARVGILIKPNTLLAMLVGSYPFPWAWPKALCQMLCKIIGSKPSQTYA